MLESNCKGYAQAAANRCYQPCIKAVLHASIKVQRGMTLLELIIVIALLSIVALASVSLIIDTGEWKQQQVTEEQWLAVKRAIVGDNVVDVHHSREYAGFVTDMGRLPNCLRELIRPYDCEVDLYGADDADPNNDAQRLTPFTQDIDSNQWYGWRGPYLGVPGANEYRDGWRNTGRDDNTGNDDDVNYGWLFGTGAPNGTECQNAVVAQQQPGAIILQSCGDDGDVDNTEAGFPADYPYTEFDGAGNPVYVPLVTRHDYQVDLGASWVNAPVKVRSATVGSSAIIAADTLRLKINYPVADGRIPDWDDALLANDIARNESTLLSATFPNRDTRLVDATGKVYIDGATPVSLPAGSSLSGTIITAPDGDIVFTDGTDISYLTLSNCPCELEVNAGTLTTNGPPATEDLSGALWIAIKPDNVAPMLADLGKYVVELPQAGTINSPTSVTLPNGASLTFSRPPNGEYDPKMVWDITGAQPTVTVSEAITMSGDLVETNSGDQFLVPSNSVLVGNVITVAKAVPPVPQGLRNMTVVCEVDGLLYDGDCTDNVTSYSPIAIPYQLEVSPRSYVRVPDEIVWDIQ